MPTEIIFFNDVSVPVTILLMCINVKVLLYYIPIDRFDIIAINAVEKLNPKLELMSNFFYYELIPNNNSELTDEEILKITI